VVIALGKEVIEELIMNLKDAGCDEELITKCIKKYNNDDLKMLIKSLQCHRCCLLDKKQRELLRTKVEERTYELEEQKKIDCLDYLIYMLKKQMKED
jgi:hypothetical protein